MVPDDLSSMRILRVAMCLYVLLYGAMLVLGIAGNLIAPKYGPEFTTSLAVGLLSVIVAGGYLVDQAFPRYFAWLALPQNLYQLINTLLVAWALPMKIALLFWYSPMLLIVLYLSGPWAYSKSNSHVSQ